MRTTYVPGGGWARIEHDDLPGPLYVRLEQDGSGRWRTRDLLLRGTWRHIVGADLRELNLAGVEEWLQPDVELFAGEDGLELDSLLGAFGPPKEQDSNKVVPRLERPTHGLTDEFLRHVAEAYRQAVSRGLAPAPELARQVGDGATPRTIHKWVMTARQRQLMPPAARKKSS